MDEIRYLNLLFSAEKLIVSKLLYVLRRQRNFHIAFSHFQDIRFPFFVFFSAAILRRRCIELQKKDWIKKLIVIFL